jgi:hypothetical protein
MHFLPPLNASFLQLFFFPFFAFLPLIILFMPHTMCGNLQRASAFRQQNVAQRPGQWVLFIKIASLGLLGDVRLQFFWPWMAFLSSKNRN